jgi:hypothetical protein
MFFRRSEKKKNGREIGFQTGRSIVFKVAVTFKFHIKKMEERDKYI